MGDLLLDEGVLSLECLLRDRGLRLLEIVVDRQRFSLLLKKDTYQHIISFDRDVELHEALDCCVQVFAAKGVN